MYDHTSLGWALLSVDICTGTGSSMYESLWPLKMLVLCIGTGSGSTAGFILCLNCLCLRFISNSGGQGSGRDLNAELGSVVQDWRRVACSHCQGWMGTFAGFFVMLTSAKSSAEMCSYAGFGTMGTLSAKSEIVS